MAYKRLTLAELARKLVVPDPEVEAAIDEICRLNPICEEFFKGDSANESEALRLKALLPLRNDAIRQLYGTLGSAENVARFFDAYVVNQAAFSAVMERFGMMVTFFVDGGCLDPDTLELTKNYTLDEMKTVFCHALAEDLMWVFPNKWDNIATLRRELFGKLTFTVTEDSDR